MPLAPSTATEKILYVDSAITFYSDPKPIVGFAYSYGYTAIAIRGIQTDATFMSLDTDEFFNPGISSFIAAAHRFAWSRGIKIFAVITGQRNMFKVILEYNAIVSDPDIFSGIIVHNEWWDYSYNDKDYVASPDLTISYTTMRSNLHAYYLACEKSDIKLYVYVENPGLNGKIYPDGSINVHGDELANLQGFAHGFIIDNNHHNPVYATNIKPILNRFTEPVNVIFYGAGTSSTHSTPKSINSFIEGRIFPPSAVTQPLKNFDDFYTYLTVNLGAAGAPIQTGTPRAFNDDTSLHGNITVIGYAADSYELIVPMSRKPATRLMVFAGSNFSRLNDGGGMLGMIALGTGLSVYDDELGIPKNILWSFVSYDSSIAPTFTDPTVLDVAFNVPSAGLYLLELSVSNAYTTTPETSRLAYIAESNTPSLTITPSAQIDPKASFELGGDVFEVTLTASGGVGPYTWSIFKPIGTGITVGNSIVLNSSFVWGTDAETERIVKPKLSADYFIAGFGITYVSVTDSLGDTQYYEMNLSTFFPGPDIFSFANVPPANNNYGISGGVEIVAESGIDSGVYPWTGLELVHTAFYNLSTYPTSDGGHDPVASGYVSPMWGVTSRESLIGIDASYTQSKRALVIENLTIQATLFLSQTLACVGQTGTIVPTTIAVTLGGYSYEWLDVANGNAVLSTTNSYTNSTSVSKVVTINITDIDDPSAGWSLQTTVEGLGAITLTETIVDATACGTQDGSISLVATNGTAPYTYLWTGQGATGLTTASITNLNPGNYTVIVTDATGCFTEAEYTLNPDLVPTISRVTVDETCRGANDGSIAVTIVYSSPVTLLWLDDGSSSYTRTGLAPGYYDLRVFTPEGCTFRQSILIDPGPGTTVTSFVTNATNGAGGAIDLTVTGSVGPYTYLWSNGATTQDLTDLAPGTYSVVIIGDCETILRSYTVENNLTGGENTGDDPDPSSPPTLTITQVKVYAYRLQCCLATMIDEYINLQEMGATVKCLEPKLKYVYMVLEALRCMPATSTYCDIDYDDVTHFIEKTSHLCKCDCCDEHDTVPVRYNESTNGFTNIEE